MGSAIQAPALLTVANTRLVWVQGNPIQLQTKMVYSTSREGASFDLSPEEHERFKAGKSVVKWTADTFGEYHIVLKKVCIGYPYIITDLDTKEVLPIVYAANKYKAVQKAFGESISSHHGNSKFGNVIALRSGKKYALKRKLRK